MHIFFIFFIGQGMEQAPLAGGGQSSAGTEHGGTKAKAAS
jgi:hypothetical protein